MYLEQDFYRLVMQLDRLKVTRCITLFTAFFQYMCMSWYACHTQIHIFSQTWRQTKGLKYPKVRLVLLVVFPEMTLEPLQIFSSSKLSQKLQENRDLSKCHVTWALLKCDILVIWAILTIQSNLKFSGDSCLKTFQLWQQSLCSHDGQRLRTKQGVCAGNTFYYSKTEGGRSSSFFLSFRQGDHGLGKLPYLSTLSPYFSNKVEQQLQSFLSLIQPAQPVLHHASSRSVLASHLVHGIMHHVIS